MSGKYPEPLLMVDLTITEFVDGRKVNECKLHRTSGDDYLTMAERVLKAMTGTSPAALADSSGGET